MKTVKAPGHLGTHGKRLWSDLQAEYDITDAGGLALLTVAAECLDRLREAQQTIDENGTILTDRYGGLKPHPAIAIEKDSRNGFLATLKQLNLDLEPLKGRVGNPGFGSNLRSVN